MNEINNKFDFLKAPYDNITGEQDFMKTSYSIAKKLINNCCIKIGKDKFYYLAEIEFYYWQWNKWNKDWNKVTYPRDNMNAGDLFYHYSGIDICFNSSFESKKYGGILIRAIMDKDGEVIAGPLLCKNYILNNCDKDHMPELVFNNNPRDIKVKPTYRALGKDDMKNGIDGNLTLCFYDSNIGNNNSSSYDVNKIPEKNVWNPRRQLFDKESGVLKTKKTTYKSPKDRKPKV